MASQRLLNSASPPRESALRLFLDCADADSLQTWLPTGLFLGVTTNPLLLQRAGVPCSVASLRDFAHQVFSLGAQEVHLQTWGPTLDDLVQTGRSLAAIDDRVVVKVPITQTGTTAAAQLIAAGIRVTLTAVYATHQVLGAAALGADYAAAYLGRISDSGRDGRTDLALMQQTLRGVHSSTRLLVASIRSLDDVVALAVQGLDTFTFSPAIAAQWFDVALTLQAAADFEQAAQAMGGTASALSVGR